MASVSGFDADRVPLVDVVDKTLSLQPVEGSKAKGDQRARLLVKTRYSRGDDQALEAGTLVWVTLGDTGWRLLVHPGCAIPQAEERAVHLAHHVPRELVGRASCSIRIAREVIRWTGRRDERDLFLRVTGFELAVW
jgi:hypothetical protein